MPDSTPLLERRRFRLVAAVVLLAASAWWVLGPIPISSGPVLVQFTSTHGVDLSDLLAFPFVALAAWLLWPLRIRAARSDRVASGSRSGN